MTVIIVISFLTGVVATLMVVSIVLKLHSLETKSDDLERRVSDLEARDGKWQPRPTEEGIMDAIANLIDAKFDIEEIKARLHTHEAKLDIAGDILSVVRLGPRAYKGNHREKKSD